MGIDLLHTITAQRLTWPSPSPLVCWSRGHRQCQETQDLYVANTRMATDSMAPTGTPSFLLALLTPNPWRESKPHRQARVWTTCNRAPRLTRSMSRHRNPSTTWRRRALTSPPDSASASGTAAVASPSRANENPWIPGSYQSGLDGSMASLNCSAASASRSRLVWSAKCSASKPRRCLPSRRSIGLSRGNRQQHRSCLWDDYQPELQGRLQ